MAWVITLNITYLMFVHLLPIILYIGVPYILLVIKLPRKGYKSITVSEAFYDQLSDAAKAESLSVPALILMMFEGQYPNYSTPEGVEKKEEPKPTCPDCGTELVELEELAKFKPQHDVGRLDGNTHQCPVDGSLHAPYLEDAEQ